MADWDPDKDGKVTLDEARARRGDLFHTFDANNDGYLDLEEFASTGDVGTMNGAEVERARAERKAMRLEDGDRDGLVSRSEYINAGSFWLDSIDRNGDTILTEADFGTMN